MRRATIIGVEHPVVSGRCVVGAAQPEEGELGVVVDVLAGLGPVLLCKALAMVR